jgi:hypothetical protein
MAVRRAQSATERHRAHCLSTQQTDAGCPVLLRQTRHRRQAATRAEIAFILACRANSGTPAKPSGRTGACRPGALTRWPPDLTHWETKSGFPRCLVVCTRGRVIASPNVPRGATTDKVLRRRKPRMVLGRAARRGAARSRAKTRARDMRSRPASPHELPPDSRYGPRCRRRWSRSAAGAAKRIIILKITTSAPACAPPKPPRGA